MTDMIRVHWILKGKRLMVLARKEVNENIITDSNWIMVIKKEQLIVRILR